MNPKLDRHGRQVVVVHDVDISFTNLFGLIFKATLAAIPAMFLLGLLAWLFVWALS